jgi:hypothetical protein
MEKVIAGYEHDSSNLTQIWMAVSSGMPGENDWRPAFRDTVKGRLVIWVKYDDVPHGDLWVKDGSGARRIARE